MLLLFLAAVLLMWWADIIQFILQAHHASHNALHGFGHGIREMSVVDIRDSNLLPLRNNRPARVAYHRAIHGHRLHHHAPGPYAVSYTHLRAHETDSYLVCRLLLE